MTPTPRSTDPPGQSEGFNLSLAFEAVAVALPDRPYVIAGSRRLLYPQVAERSRRLASFLHDQGLGVHTERPHLRGHESGQDHVAVALFNGSEYLEAMLGSFRTRAVPFNVNYRYTGEELRYLLLDARPRALIYDASLAQGLAEVLPAVPSIEVLVQVADGTDTQLLPGAVDYEAALASSSPEGPQTSPDPDDLYMLYTGGTTGMPKGVLWRQHDIFMAAMGGRRLGSWDEVSSYEQLALAASERQGRRLLLLPPLMHGAAQWAAFQAIRDGSSVVFVAEPRSFDATDVWSTVERERCNIVTLVGNAMARPLIEELDNHDYDLSSLIAVGNGGAPLTSDARDALLQRVPTLTISDAGGSSETGAQMFQLTPTAHAAPVFRPGPGAVLVDAERTRFLEKDDMTQGWLGQTGYIPLGYLNDEQKSAATFPVVGSTRCAIPGDRARWTAGGDIELLGRDAVTINSGGEKIFAEEVERALLSHPAVADAVVAGRPSTRWGQEVVAIVQLNAGADATADDLATHAGKSLARYKLPKEIRFVPQIVRSPSGKADYRWANQMVAQ
jgi:fatty-acyl-CoA synthase